jgi:hypothetical protein
LSSLWYAGLVENPDDTCRQSVKKGRKDKQNSYGNEDLNMEIPKKITH